MRIRSSLVILGSAIASCVLPDAALDGLPCPCSDGYVCDTVANECVPTGAGAQGPGPGPTNGGSGAMGASGAGGPGAGGSGASGAGASGAGAAGAAGSGGAGPGGSGGVGPGGSGGVGPGGSGGSGAGGGGPLCGNGTLDEFESCDPPTPFICDADCDPILSGMEDCSDQIDNDSDSEVDCDDGECDCVCAPALATPTQNGSNLDAHAIHSGFCVGWDGNPEVLYTFTAAFPGALDLEMFSPDDQGLYVRTDCDDQDSEIGCVDENPGGDTERLIVPAGAGQTVTIFVDTFYPEAAGTFSITASLDPLNEAEPNNAIGEADLLGGGAAGTTGMVQPVGDQDYFTFTLAATTIVSLDIVPIGPVECTFDSEITLFDNTGTEIDYDDDGGTQGCSSLTTMLGAGTYFVRVGSPQTFPNQASFVYRLILN